MSSFWNWKANIDIYMEMDKWQIISDYSNSDRAVGFFQHQHELSLHEAPYCKSLLRPVHGVKCWHVSPEESRRDTQIIYFNVEVQ